MTLRRSDAANLIRFWFFPFMIPFNSCCFFNSSFFVLTGIIGLSNCRQVVPDIFLLVLCAVSNRFLTLHLYLYSPLLQFSPSNLRYFSLRDTPKDALRIPEYFSTRGALRNSCLL